VLKQRIPSRGGRKCPTRILERGRW
jgi:hypothetical protein